MLRKVNNILKYDVRKLSSYHNEFINFTEKNGAAIIELNRPKALNAISRDMFKSINLFLREMESKKNLIIFKGNEKIFSSGGDVKDAAFSSIKDGKDLFRHALTSFHIVHNYKIPFVPLIRGIAFGGSADYSVAAKKYRVVTENSVFSMPETTIGHFNDNGSSYFLSRVPKNIGIYMSLASARIKSFDIIKIGLADCFIENSRIKDLEDNLVLCRNPQEIENILKKFSSPLPKETELDAIAPIIEKCFGGKTVEKIIDNLHADGSDWAMEMIKTINKMSPTSLKVCLLEIQRGKSMSLDECLKMEFRLAAHHVTQSDLHEGIQALLIRRDNNPQWNPKTLAEVKLKDVNHFFEPLEDGDELIL